MVVLRILEIFLVDENFHELLLNAATITLIPTQGTLKYVVKILIL